MNGFIMNAFEKIKHSLWVLISFIPMLNGFGFVYIGFKNNNRNWIFEGVMYEIPWIAGIIFSENSAVLDKLVIFAIILMLVSIIRSIWVAIKLADVYDNEDKYTVRPTVVNNHNKPKENNNGLASFGCCLCIIVIFIVFAIIAI